MSSIKLTQKDRKNLSCPVQLGLVNYDTWAKSSPRSVVYSLQAENCFYIWKKKKKKVRKKKKNKEDYVTEDNMYKGSPSSIVHSSRKQKATSIPRTVEWAI